MCESFLDLYNWSYVEVVFRRDHGEGEVARLSDTRTYSIIIGAEIQANNSFDCKASIEVIRRVGRVILRSWAAL